MDDFSGTRRKCISSCITPLVYCQLLVVAYMLLSSMPLDLGESDCVGSSSEEYGIEKPPEVSISGQRETWSRRSDGGVLHRPVDEFAAS